MMPGHHDDAHSMILVPAISAPICRRWSIRLTVAGRIDEKDWIRDLLDLSRVQSPDTKPQLSPLRAGEVFALIRNTMGPPAKQKNVTLSFTGNEQFTFPSDKRLLTLVIKNLVENSLKFTPAGGTVTLNIEPQNGQAIVRVIDTGIGIPPQHRHRVFERFYQVDAARSSATERGTDLGLAIVKHAVHALGGAVGRESEVGKGTRWCAVSKPAGKMPNKC
jgi:two-component system, OmpR family, phosphate regulon sensor histidine kinase PhoR